MSAAPTLKLAPKCITIVDQYKYDIDSSRAWPVRFLFHWVWCPMIEIGFWLKFPLWDTIDKQGRKSYREFQGAFSTRWKAENEAAKHAHPSIMDAIIDESQPVESILASTVHPGAVTNAYERINNRRAVLGTIDDARRLADELKATRKVVEANKSLLA